MKKFYFAIAFAAIALMTSCTNNYKLAFGLGDDIAKVEELLKGQNIKYKCETDDDYTNVKHIKTGDATIDNIEYKSIEASFLNDKVVFMKYNVPEGEKGEKGNEFISFIKNRFGEPVTTLKQKNNDAPEYYWGDANKTFCIVKRNGGSFINKLFNNKVIEVLVGNTDIENPHLSNKIREKCFE